MSKGDFISFNGKLVSSNALNIGIDNRSFRYGDGLFESMRCVEGNIPFWDFHIQRLKSGLEILGIDCTEAQINEIKQKAKTLMQHNEHHEAARIRLSVYRDGAGNYIPETNKMGYCIESWSLENREYRINEKGLNTDLYTRIKKPLNILSMVKSANAQLFVLAGKFAVENQLDEAFILNQRNELVESVSANVFMIKDNKIYTPPLSSGCLPGVMRMVIVSLLAKKNIKVAESTISPSDLILADEIFITNSIRGIQWVGGYQSKRYYKKYSELLVEELNKVFISSD